MRKAILLFPMMIFLTCNPDPKPPKVGKESIMLVNKISLSI